MPFINKLNGGLNGIGSLIGGKPEPEYYGARKVFAQASAPPGWIKDTSLNDYSLRIVNSSVSFNGTGGSVNFTSVFSPSVPTYKPVTGTWPYSMDPHTISTSEMEAHVHTSMPFAGRTSKTNSPSSSPYKSLCNGTMTTYPLTSMNSTGTGGGHIHSGTIDSWNFSNTAAMDIRYLDVIIARY